MTNKREYSAAHGRDKHWRFSVSPCHFIVHFGIHDECSNFQLRILMSGRQS
jgi:hypothetical protein